MPGRYGNSHVYTVYMNLKETEAQRLKPSKNYFEFRPHLENHKKS